ncbi:MAG TPA: FAD-binding oxidoreductase [Gemmatimonadaceae bacterium]|nr:FAD-binding oxidoreductase [Gemmatimonadaceae bacterium]
MASAEIVICGAGMAGAAAAYQLAVRHRVPNVVLIDEREPLSLTSNKGTQGYRNWFDGPDDTMARFVGRSVGIIEELAESSGNVFQLSRTGYAFVTADETMRARIRAQAERLTTFGAGPIREHPGPTPYQPNAADGDWRGIPDGADLLFDPLLVREHFGFVSDDAIAVSHVRRAGWMDAIRLGHWLIDQACRHGARVVRDRVVGVGTSGGVLKSVRLGSGTELFTGRLAIAAGPGLPNVLRMVGVDIPVFLELHAKMRFEDRLGVVPRNAPFTIWADPVDRIDWSAAERARFEGDPAAEWLLAPFPGGLHVRPVGSDRDVYLIWTFESSPHEFIWPPSFDQNLGEVLLRGFATLAPRAAAYIGEGHRGFVDGGYYAKTPENRPIVGPLPVEGVYVTGALSGYGIMASHAAGELLATHMTGGTLPEYAAALLPSRYTDPAYLRRLEQWDPKAGQL